MAKVVKEVGSGINDSRPKLLALLAAQSIDVIVVEDKDRLTHFGFRYLDTLLTAHSRAIEVVDQPETDTDDLLADLAAIIYHPGARGPLPPGTGVDGPLPPGNLAISVL